MTDDPLNACNVLLKYRRTCHPSQKYLYCHTVKPSEDAENKVEGMKTVWFAKDRRMGINYIQKLSRELARKAGCDNYQTITGTSICCWVLTKLANDDSISQKEVQEHACHRSCTSQNHYIRTSEMSQLNRQMAMARGFNIIRSTTTDTTTTFESSNKENITTTNPYIRKKNTTNPYIRCNNPYLKNNGR